VTDQIIALALRLAIIVGSLAVHEAAHGLAARWLGDPTASRLGRVTLNPLKHLDPQGSLLFPGLLLVSQWAAGATNPVFFGWAKPVPVDPRYFRRPFRDMALVAAAGPASNLVLALIGAQVFQGLREIGGTGQVISQLLVAIILINLSLMLFNLIPLPPLDGSKILWGPLFPLMPIGFRRWYAELTPGQRIFGPLLVVVAVGVLFYLAGYAPWTWFNRVLGGAIFATAEWVLRFAQATWSWL
jgi:Zn-dependent protease